MQPIYEHKQFGLVMLLILSIATTGLVIAVMLTAEPGSLVPLLVILSVILLTGVIFGSLTVKVDAEQVRLHFGLNFLGRVIPLERITAVRVVRNPLWMGLGIHFFWRGVIYNVSGLDGVELTLENGSLIRIGTDEPSALAQAIERARRDQMRKPFQSNDANQMTFTRPTS